MYDDGEQIGSAGVRAMLEAELGQARCRAAVAQLLKRGRKLPDGTRIFLATTIVGRTRVTTRGEVRRFLDRLKAEGVLHLPMCGRYPRRKAAAV